jgi:hypothetical protein
MDDAWLIDTGDWRQPSIVVLQSTQPRRLNDVRQLHAAVQRQCARRVLCLALLTRIWQILNQYLAFLQAQGPQAGDDSSVSAAQAFSETFSGWLEEKGIIGYNR